MEHTIGLYETAVVRRRFFGATWSVIYAGMPSRDRYSLALTWTMGHQASSYNVYLERTPAEIPLGSGRLRVLELSPQRVRLRFDEP
jgi:hypothetical protein